MKALFFGALAILTAGIMIAGKPSDQECIQQVKKQMGLQLPGGVLDQLTTEACGLTLQVEDHIFYKTITSRLDGSVVGRGVMGYVYLNN